MAKEFTWKELVVEALQAKGGEASLRQITKALESHPARPHTETWQATIRRVVRQYNIFAPFKTAKGEAGYRLVKLPTAGASTSGEDPHGEQQGMLLELGRFCGYETFTNTTDKTIRKFRGKALAGFATVRNDADDLLALPLKKMRDTDVMWMAEDSEGLYPKYAFEIENSTKVKHGLLRLLKIPERFNTGLFIIGAGDEEAALFERYLKDAPFRQHSGRFRFFRYSDVAEFYQNGNRFDQAVKRWGIRLTL
ncbi:MAG TPA: hypothetical protein VH280_09625 [Verrucomicrobiae bacterium]|jgi:hypothetical protein|nr:hypothetical protein [Verrucomicrobiae bacterium]